MKAIIRAYTPNPKNPRVLLTYSIDDGEAIPEGPDTHLSDTLAMEGAIGMGGKKYFPKDGESFLRALPFRFTSGYLRAEVTE